MSNEPSSKDLLFFFLSFLPHNPNHSFTTTHTALRTQPYIHTQPCRTHTQHMVALSTSHSEQTGRVVKRETVSSQNLRSNAAQLALSAVGWRKFS